MKKPRPRAIASSAHRSSLLTAPALLLFIVALATNQTDGESSFTPADDGRAGTAAAQAEVDYGTVL